MVSEKTVSLASQPGANETEAQNGLVTLGLLSLVAGGGFGDSLFGFGLDHADSFRDADSIFGFRT
jgi:hypothetical protein